MTAGPMACTSPSSLYSFTEEELMLKDTGKRENDVMYRGRVSLN
jgi:hypothetical protein